MLIFSPSALPPLYICKRPLAHPIPTVSGSSHNRWLLFHIYASVRGRWWWASWFSSSCPSTVCQWLTPSLLGWGTFHGCWTFKTARELRRLSKSPLLTPPLTASFPPILLVLSSASSLRHPTTVPLSFSCVIAKLINLVLFYVL